MKKVEEMSLPELEKYLDNLEMALDDISACDMPKLFSEICESIDEVQTLIQLKKDDDKRL